MMSLVRIQNRGKNLWDKFTANDIDVANTTATSYYFLGKRLVIPPQSVKFVAFKVPIRQGITYTFSGTIDGQLYIYSDKIFGNLLAYSSVITGNVTLSFNNTETNYIIVGCYSDPIVDTTYDLDTFQLEEGSEATEYEPPRNDYIEFDAELFGYAGVFDELRDDGTLIKRWQRESITITSSGTGSVSKNGTGTCILVADSDGVPYEGTVSDTDVNTSAPEGTYTIIYQLATPEISKIPIHSTMKALGSGHNQFLATKYDKDTFTGDGVTTTFNLSKTANSTNYSVKVNGVEITEGITKNTTSVVFDTAPRNGAIIEVYYNAEPETLWCTAIEVYEPSGTQETLSQFTELSITENDDVVTAKFDDGTFKKVVKSRDFTVTLNKALIENAENFIQKYRDKKFRMIITNSRDSSVEYVAMCEFDTSRSKNYMDGTENITIRCTDLYD